MIGRRSFIGSIIGTVAGLPFVAQEPPKIEGEPNWLIKFQLLLDILNKKDIDSVKFIIKLDDGTQFLQLTENIVEEDKEILFIPKPINVSKKMNVIGFSLLLKNKLTTQFCKFPQTHVLTKGDTLDIKYSLYTNDLKSFIS